MILSRILGIALTLSLALDPVSASAFFPPSSDGMAQGSSACVLRFTQDAIPAPDLAAPLLNRFIVNGRRIKISLGGLFRSNIPPRVIDLTGLNRRGWIGLAFWVLFPLGAAAQSNDTRSAAISSQSEASITARVSGFEDAYRQLRAERANYPRDTDAYKEFGSALVMKLQQIAGFKISAARDSLMKLYEESGDDLGASDWASFLRDTIPAAPAAKRLEAYEDLVWRLITALEGASSQDPHAYDELLVEIITDKGARMDGLDALPLKELADRSPSVVASGVQATLTLLINDIQADPADEIDNRIIDNLVDILKTLLQALQWQLNSAQEDQLLAVLKSKDPGTLRFAMRALSALSQAKLLDSARLRKVVQAISNNPAESPDIKEALKEKLEPIQPPQPIQELRKPIPQYSEPAVGAPAPVKPRGPGGAALTHPDTYLHGIIRHRLGRLAYARWRFYRAVHWRSHQAEIERPLTLFSNHRRGLNLKQSIKMQLSREEREWIELEFAPVYEQKYFRSLTVASRFTNAHPIDRQDVAAYRKAHSDFKSPRSAIENRIQSTRNQGKRAIIYAMAKGGQSGFSVGVAAGASLSVVVIALEQMRYGGNSSAMLLTTPAATIVSQILILVAFLVLASWSGEKLGKRRAGIAAHRAYQKVYAVEGAALTLGQPRSPSRSVPDVLKARRRSFLAAA